MRFIAAISATVGLLIACLGSAAGPAQAASCPADQTVLSYSKNDPPYQCAVHYWSSTKSISAWDTKSWTADTAFGYYVESKCAYRSSSDVTWTWTNAGPSFMATFTNWADGTRHYASGVIFTTGEVDDDQIKSDNNCANNDGKIKNSIKKITESVKIDSISGYRYWGEVLTISGTVSPSSTTGMIALLVDGNPVLTNGYPVAAQITDGKFAMQWKTPKNAPTGTVNLQAVYQGDETACPAAAKSCGYTPGQSAVTTITIEKANVAFSGDEIPSEPVLLSGGSGLPTTAGASSSSVSASAQADPGIKVINARATTPKQLGAECPDGYSPLNAELWGGSSSRLLGFGRKGVSLKKGAIKNGRKVGIQLTCRKSGKGLSNRGRIGFGTPKNDHMKTKARGALLLGGVSDDSLVVNRPGGVANGGNHDDLITLRTAGVGIGGPGDDMLRSLTRKRTLLIGGPGRDLIAASGRARIDARDGRVDRVVCRGKKVRVKADRYDRLRGACIRV